MKLVPAWLVRLFHRVGRRGAFLICMASLFLVSGYSYITEPPQPQTLRAYSVILEYVTLEQLGYLWLAIGALMVFGAFLKRAVEQVSFALGAGMIWAFGLSFIASLQQAGAPLGQILRGAVVYVLFGALFLVIASWSEPWRNHGGDR